MNISHRTHYPVSSISGIADKRCSKNSKADSSLVPDGEEKKQSRMTKQSFEGLTCLTLSTVGGAGFGTIFRGVIGGLTRLDIDKGLEGLVGKQAEFSRGQASPHAVHLVHGGGDEVNDGGDEADGQPGIEEEKCQGQAD